MFHCFGMTGSRVRGQPVDCGCSFGGKNGAIHATLPGWNQEGGIGEEERRGVQDGDQKKVPDRKWQT
jgi:hypothetical protein